MPELEIRNLHVQAEDKQILKGVDLTVKPGEIHALMGPNGSGKSTLANAIMGHPSLEVSEGQILFGGEDIKMDQVVLALEGSLAPMECFVDDRADDGRVLCSHHDDSGRGCATKLLWTRVQVGVTNTLAQTSLAELIDFQTRQLPRVGERAAPDDRTPAHA